MCWTLIYMISISQCHDAHSPEDLTLFVLIGWFIKVLNILFIYANILIAPSVTQYITVWWHSAALSPTTIKDIYYVNAEMMFGI